MTLIHSEYRHEDSSNESRRSPYVVILLRYDFHSLNPGLNAEVCAHRRRVPLPIQVELPSAPL